MTFLDKSTFTSVINNAPLVSIDLLIENSKGDILLGYRSNRPAQGFWFVPGGRILKGESLDNAFERLTFSELGLSVSRSSAAFIGPFEHFYDDFVFGDEVSTHYVVLAYKLTLDIDICNMPSEQHNDYKWFTKELMLTDNTVHKHSKWYLE